MDESIPAEDLVTDFHQSVYAAGINIRRVPKEKDMPAITFPMEIQAIQFMSELDPGCSHALLSEQWVEEHHIPFRKSNGTCEMADGTIRPLTGITERVTVRTGNVSLQYEIPIGKTARNVTLLVGRHMAAKIGIRIEGIPTSIGPPPAQHHAEPETPMRLAEYMADEPVKYTDFRKKLITQLQPEIAANKAIADDAVIPLKEAVVKLQLTDQKPIWVRQYPIPFRFHSTVDETVQHWLRNRAHLARTSGNNLQQPADYGSKEGRPRQDSPYEAPRLFGPQEHQ